MKKLKIGTKVYSTQQTFMGEVEAIGKNTIDLRCQMWQTTNAIGNNILVRFDKSYLIEGENEIELCQKVRGDKEIWGKII